MIEHNAGLGVFGKNRFARILKRKQCLQEPRFPDISLKMYDALVFGARSGIGNAFNSHFEWEDDPIPGTYSDILSPSRPFSISSQPGAFSREGKNHYHSKLLSTNCQNGVVLPIDLLPTSSANECENASVRGKFRRAVIEHRQKMSDEVPKSFETYCGSHKNSRSQRILFTGYHGGSMELGRKCEKNGSIYLRMKDSMTRNRSIRGHCNDQVTKTWEIIPSHSRLPRRDLTDSRLKSWFRSPSKGFFCRHLQLFRDDRD